MVPELVGHIGGFVCIYCAASTFFFPTQILGRSMLPTIQAGSWVLVSAIPRQKIERGDIIVLMYVTVRCLQFGLHFDKVPHDC